jgi:hypothetical protein
VPRSHDRNAFYKFATRPAARAMIEHKTLRWTNPLRFNDPFDTQTRIVATNAGDERFVHAFTERYREILFSEVLPAYFKSDNELHRIAALVRNAPDDAKHKAVERFRRGAPEMGENLDPILAKFSAEISSHLQHGQVFCLTEDINNVVMWSHYAEDHKGVGFKLRVLEELDHPFLVARKVNYSRDYINMGTAEDIADHLFAVKTIDMVALCWEMVILKHRDWEYEREWRCYWPLLDRDVPAGFTDYRQDARLFESIYLGCCMPDNEAQEFVQLVRHHLPATPVFKVRKSTANFDLQFDVIYSPESA